MRNFKKFLTLVLAVMMVVSAMSFTSSAATKFEDVDADNKTLVKAINLLEYMGITKGVSETQFGADQKVTREQFALFMYRLMKGGKNAPANASNTTKFVDLKDQTYFYAIGWANAEGIINGTSDTTFHPTNEITLQDAYTMIVRALDYEDPEVAEEALIYPFGYIEVAESEGVALDAGLDSTIGYGDTLTRGDMAILLYNAFFAETAIPEIEQKIIETSTNNWKVEETKYYPELCIKNFGVEKAVYQAAATPHYTSVNEKPTYTLGYDAILFTLDTTDKECLATTADVPSQYYLEPADIGLEGEDLDEFFLGKFTMYVKGDAKDIDKVLFADCKKEVVEGVDNLELVTLTSNRANSYYASSDAKLLSGEVKVGANESFYVFNAPYSYIRPSYANAKTDAAKYAVRNTNNIKSLSYVKNTFDSDVDSYTVSIAPIVSNYVANGAFVDGMGNPTNTPDEYFTLQANDLAEEFQQVYYGGEYEADLYDVNGDGVYDYIDYHPYSFFKVNTDEDYSFADSTLPRGFNAYEDVAEYYVGRGIDVVGATFADGDYVIGYVDNAKKELFVKEVVKPVVASVDRIVAANNMLVLSDGNTVEVGTAWKTFENFVPFYNNAAFDKTLGFVKADKFDDYAAATATKLGFFKASLLDADEASLYIYDGKLIYSDEINNNVKFTENLLIPLTLGGTKTPKDQFLADSGKEVTYIYAYVDGELKYVPVETEDVNPAIVKNGALTADYENHLCTYSVDADGVYTVISLDKNNKLVYDANQGRDVWVYDGIPAAGKNNMVDTNDDGVADKFVLDTDDDDYQYIVHGEANVSMKKEAGTRFSLTNINDAGAKGRDVVLKSFSKIVVLQREIGAAANGKDKYTVLEYDASNFTADTKVPFKTVSYILANNPTSTVREDLVVLFATVDSKFGFTSKEDKNGHRIVSSSTPGLDEEGYFRNYYELYNPFTGEKETDVPGDNVKTKSDAVATLKQAEGAVVVLKNGVVDEVKANNAGAVDPANLKSNGLVWITEYDAADDFITVVPVVATENALGTQIDCIDSFANFVETYKYNGVEKNFDGQNFDLKYQATTPATLNYTITKDTAISVISYETAGSFLKYGRVKLGSVDMLANPANEFKCYNDKFVDKSTGDYMTKYAPYLMAYVSTSDSTDKDELPVADYIVVVVTNHSNLQTYLKSAYDAGCNH